MAATPPHHVTLLVAHGSRASSANQAHLDLAAALDARIEPTVLGAFMELAEPSIGDAIGRAVDAGATVVAVLPYFLHPGRHQQVDIPQLVAEAAADVPLLYPRPGVVEQDLSLIHISEPTRPY